VVLNIATYVVATLLMFGVPGRHRAEAAAEDVDAGKVGRRLTTEFVAGLRAASNSPMLRVVFAVLALVSIGEGVMGSLFAVFVARALDGGAAELGYLASGQAIGGVVGGLAGAWIGRRVAVHRQVAVGMVLFGLIDIVIFNYPRWLPEVWPGVALMALVGVPGALIMAGFMTILQSEVGDAYRGRVFSAAMVVQSMAMLAGTGLAATLTDRLGVIPVLTAQGAGYAIGGVCFGLLARRARRPTAPAETAAAEPEVVRTAP
jgi:Na+/melibiose symporter-like transporter